MRPDNLRPRKVETSKAARGLKLFETLAKISLKTDKLLITLSKTASKEKVRFRDKFLVGEDLQNKSLNSKESVVISPFRRS